MAIRQRRTKNYWEPIYNPELTGEFVDHDWNFENNKGPTKCTFLAEKLPQRDVQIFGSIHFQECDFSGVFSENRLIFKNCKFTFCDFGLSKFQNEKFSECEFHDCSFTQSDFKESEFRNCVFERIGISGNETKLEGTLITNPGKFILGAVTNTKYLPANKSAFEQKLKLQETKSTVARILLANLTNEGSERTFYDAVKTSTIYECYAKIAHSLLTLKKNCNISTFWSPSQAISLIFSTFGVIGGAIDFLVLYAFGLINGWGASLARPLMVGVGLVSGFGCYYSTHYEISFFLGSKIAAELLLLFGYTNYGAAKSLMIIDQVIFFNSVSGNPPRN